MRLKSIGGKGGRCIYKIYKGWFGDYQKCFCIWPGPKKKSFSTPPSCQRLPSTFANTAQKSVSRSVSIGELITNFMLSRNAMHCVTILYILSLSSICTVLLSCKSILGLIISIAIWFKFPSILDSIFWVGRPM